MTTAQSPVSHEPTEAASPFYSHAYRVFAYFGVMTVLGSLLFGFRYSPTAPAGNYLIGLLLYGVFVAPHLVMTRGWWKRTFWGDEGGSPRERRFYITITIVTWLGVIWIQQAFLPMSGGALALSPQAAGLLRFVGIIGFLFYFRLFFEGSTLEAIDRLLGVPGNTISHTHGPRTPLFTEGPYARVRHPMYQAALFCALSSLLIHPNLAQVFWAAMIGATFLAFIPIEEAQLVAARGDDYRHYQKQVPYRLLRGIW